MNADDIGKSAHGACSKDATPLQASQKANSEDRPPRILRERPVDSVKTESELPRRPAVRLELRSRAENLSKSE